VNAILTVFETVAPIFLIGTAGFVWVKLGFEYRVEFVTRLAMTLAVPCLIFTSLMKTRLDPGALGELLLASVLAYGGVAVAAAALVWVTGLERRTFLAPLIFGNTGNLGFPLALFAFGQAGLSYAVIVFGVMAILSFTVGIWMVRGSSNPMVLIKEPVVGATVLGAVFMRQGWMTPDWLGNGLDLIGQMAIPMMLLTLGVSVARLAPGRITQAVLLSAAKLAICVAVAWAVGRWFDLNDTAFAILVLQVSTPVAVTSYLLAQKYGADAQAVAGLVVVSTLMSVAALPVLLTLLL